MRVDLLHSLFENAAERGVFHGTVGVYENGRAVYEAAMGLADFETGRPLTVNSLFDLASITKQFTASAVMLLSQRGALCIEDPIQKYYPNMPYPGVTLAMLMNHTGGLPDEDWCVQFLSRTDRPILNDDLIGVLESQPAASLFAPGQNWAYSNIAYELLASVVERVSGRGFEDFIQRELLLPSGMADSLIYHRYSGLPVPEHFADSRVLENGRLLRPDQSAHAKFTVPLEGVNGAGLVYSNLHDMLNWDRALREGRILTETTQARMRECVDTGAGERYGLGWFVAENGALMHHGGFWPGYVNEYSRWLDHDRVLVILTNLTRDQRAMSSLVECARAIASDRECPKFETTADRIDPSADPADFHRFAGEYGRGVTVAFNQSALTLSWGDGIDLPLVPVGGNCFRSVADRNDYIFEQGSLIVRNRRGEQLLVRA